MTWRNVDVMGLKDLENRSSTFGGSKWPNTLPTRERLIGYSVALLFLMVGVMFGLRWLERTITFHPVQYDPRQPWVTPLGAEDVGFSTADGVRLHGWFFHHPTKPSIATIIFFHGNGGNISNVGWVGEQLASSGFDVLLFDYRGYGRSEGEVEDERGIYSDADAAFEFLIASGVPQDSIALYGQSLGTAAAVDLAHRGKGLALILESGLSSESDMAASIFPWLPRFFHSFAKNRFESARKLQVVSCPVLITHGDPDSTIPTEQGRVLFAAANEPKKLIIFPGAGHNVFGFVGVKYLEIVAEFVRDAVKSRKR